VQLSRIMHSGTEPVDFKPPPPGRWSMPMTLAVLVHGALIVALAWGVNWNKETTPVAFEAELWSALPREAAPRAVQPPPPPPEPAPTPAPAPVPAPPPPPPAPTPTVREPDIATQQAKKKAEEDKRAREEAARKAEAQRKAAAEKAAAEKAAAERRRQEQQREAQARQERQRQEAQRRAAAEAQAAERLREENMRRIMGQAGATGPSGAQGTADRSSGPSAGYAARVAARIRPNIVYTEEFPARLATEIEVRAAPDGNILSRRVVRGSGNSAWDEAALRAIDRTGSLPRDTDGRVPSPLIVEMRPLD